MNITIMIKVKDDNDEYVINAIESPPVPKTSVFEFGSELSGVTRQALKDLVTKFQRDAGWMYDELTYENN